MHLSLHLLPQQLIYTLTLNFRFPRPPRVLRSALKSRCFRLPKGRCYIFVFYICFLYFCAMPCFPNKGRKRLQKRRLTGNLLAKHTVPPFIMQIHTLSMSSGALKNQPKQKGSTALALPAPPPRRSLLC